MKIVVEAYDPDWPARFAEVERVVRGCLQGLSPAVEHIGSTSVVGLAAKPTIDVLVGLEGESDLDLVTRPIVDCGYTYFRIYEPYWPSRRFFAKLVPLRDVAPPAMIDIGEVYVSGKNFRSLANVHVVVKDSEDWTRHLAFRDFLRAHPEIRDAYSQLKRTLSEQEFRDQAEYSAAKDGFIRETERLAMEWVRV